MSVIGVRPDIARTCAHVGFWFSITPRPRNSSLPSARAGLERRPDIGASSLPRRPFDLPSRNCRPGAFWARSCRSGISGSMPRVSARFTIIRIIRCGARLRNRSAVSDASGTVPGGTTVVLQKWTAKCVDLRKEFLSEDYPFQIAAFADAAFRQQCFSAAMDLRSASTSLTMCVAGAVRFVAPVVARSACASASRRRWFRTDL